MAPTPPCISPLSLHDALPISAKMRAASALRGSSTETRNPDDWTTGGRDWTTRAWRTGSLARHEWSSQDRKSTRLNSSHLGISYAVFCLKKKNKETNIQQQ